MERLVSVVIGYVFGLLQTGYLYGKIHHVDIRKQGSGNAGTTNALRTMGWKAGVVTLLGDAFKCVFAVLLVRFLYKGSHGDMLPLLSMYAGMGAVLGHNYPFYMKFKGGKGIATTAGLLLSTTNAHLSVCILRHRGRNEVCVGGISGGGDPLSRGSHLSGADRGVWDRAGLSL